MPAWRTTSRCFRELDLDMIGIGPFIPHPATPLGNGRAQFFPPVNGEQVPNTELMVYKAVALDAAGAAGREHSGDHGAGDDQQEQRTRTGPAARRECVHAEPDAAEIPPLYEIYPAKACIAETGDACNGCLADCASNDWPPHRHAARAAGGRPAECPLRNRNRRKEVAMPEIPPPTSRFAWAAPASRAGTAATSK
jgi:hypothetical protein